MNTKMMSLNLQLLLICIAMIACVVAKKPNIVMILTDDQDTEIGGMTPIQKTISLIGNHGITYKNAFTSSPLCCPSRSSILTGKYVHNNHAYNNSVPGGCNSQSWRDVQEQKTFATYIHAAGYKTFYAGKYLNQYGVPNAGGVSHVPPGWDWWTGLVGNSKYYDYDLSVNGTRETHGHDPSKDYFTNLIRDRGVEFLKQQSVSSEQPFLMVLSTPAPHQPFTPEPKYENAYANMSAPRNANFDVKPGDDKHWLLRLANDIPLDAAMIKQADDFFRNRWRTLLSVDDLVAAVMAQLQSGGHMNNTYVIYTSDHGYHLGQFRLPYDKRQLYEFDIRVPLMMRGPGIDPNHPIKSPSISVNVDLAPTMLDMAGVPIPDDMDGISLLRHEDVKKRATVSVSHCGTGSTRPVRGCPGYNYGITECSPNCVCEDSFNNTYTCSRTLDPMDAQFPNLIFCAFSDTENFHEMYDLDADPYQFNNLVRKLPKHVFNKYSKHLAKLSTCTGKECHKLKI